MCSLQALQAAIKTHSGAPPWLGTLGLQRPPSAFRVRPFLRSHLSPSARESRVPELGLHGSGHAEHTRRPPRFRGSLALASRRCSATVRGLRRSALRAPSRRALASRTHARAGACWRRWPPPAAEYAARGALCACLGSPSATTSP